jgi:HEAT repeat protein
VSALRYMVIYMKDERIADGLLTYLAEPRDVTSMSTAMHILAEDFADRRLAPIAMRILESDIHRQFRYNAAFALAKVSESAADELIARLSHMNPEVRAAVTAALRQAKDRRAIEPLRALLKIDTDPEVRMQATTTLRWLEEDITI